MLKYLWRRYGPNPFDQQLRRARAEQKKRFLLCWNRGLGDIPLGLYALNTRIRSFLPDAEITYVTRSDLLDGFKMLQQVSTIEDPAWKRGVAFDLDASLSRVGKTRGDFDVVIEHPNPSRWLLWQLKSLTPRLTWDPAWDRLAERFGLPERCIGVHVQTETTYGYEKNWPVDYWKDFFERVSVEHNGEIVLFGMGNGTHFLGPHVHDMRGRTSLFEMLSIIKNHCRYLLVPDSGVLSMTYYIDAPFPIDIVSLWADPRQGVLKQGVASPNPQLAHRPLIAKKGNLRSVSVPAVMEALFHK